MQVHVALAAEITLQEPLSFDVRAGDLYTQDLVGEDDWKRIFPEAPFVTEDIPPEPPISPPHLPPSPPWVPPHEEEGEEVVVRRRRRRPPTIIDEQTMIAGTYVLSLCSLLW